MGGARLLRAWKDRGAPEKWGREPQGGGGSNKGERRREVSGQTERSSGRNRRQMGQHVSREAIMEPRGQMGREGTGVRKTKDATGDEKTAMGEAGLPEFPLLVLGTASFFPPPRRPPPSPQSRCRGHNRAWNGGWKTHLCGVCARL